MQVGQRMRVIDKNAPFLGSLVTVTMIADGLVFCEDPITKKVEPFLPEELAYP